jgi:hypothetical protein
VNDRSYYRTLPIKALIDAGRDSGDELAIALAERLADLDWELEHESRTDFRKLSEAYDEVCAELADYRDQLRNNEHIYEG